MTAPETPPTRKKEGWRGVVVTALLCGLFLWWWFQPAPVSAETERDPLYWAGRARAALGSSPPSLAQRLEIIMISEALRAQGDEGPAEALEVDWLPSAWRATATLPTDDGAPWDDRIEAADTDGSASPTPVAVPAGMESLWPPLDLAATAFDTLEIEAGQQALQEAARVAAAQPEPARTHGLWLVAARQARNGLEADAAATRKQVRADGGGEFPDWLVAEMVDGGVVAPVVAACATRPEIDPLVMQFIDRWRSMVRDRWRHRDHPLLTRHGPAADASATREPAGAGSLWAHVEANRLTAAAALAGDDPSAHLAIARLLVWLADPPPT